MSASKALLASALFLFLTLPIPAGAQMPEPQRLVALAGAMDAQRALAIYVDALTSRDAAKLAAATTDDFYRQLAASKATYPILTTLGPVLKVEVAAAPEFAGAKIYRATVEHANGRSLWQMRLSQDSRIANAELSQVVETPRPIAPASPRPDIASVSPSKSWNGSIFGSTKGTVLGGVFSDTSTFRNDVLAKSLTRPNVSSTITGLPSPTPPPAPPPPSVSPTPSAATPNATTQQPCARDAGLCAGPTSDTDSRLVEFLFATDRKLTITSSKTVLPIDTDRDGKLSYGAVSVHIPRDDMRAIGQITLPSVWKLFGFTLWQEKPDEDKHFVLKRIAPLSLDDFKQLARQQSKRSALVFVHGFNTSFEDALYRNAQVVYDLGYKGLSVLYAWTSKGSVADYVYDRDSADAARDGFIALLNMLRDEIKVETVNVIAHSMGNRVVMDAMKNDARTSKPVRVDQLIMAAPDVARDAFMTDMPIVMGLTTGTTLYASSADKALKLSGTLASFPRAGDVPAAGPIILPKLDTIDVTAIGDEFLGLNHTEFATNRSLIDDIKLLIEERRISPRLAQIRPAPEAPQPRTYWRFAK